MKHIKDFPSIPSSYWTYALDFCWNKPPFEGLRSLAIARMGDISTPMEIFTLGRKYHVKQWMVEGLRSLVTEPCLPPQKELQVLGHSTLIRFLYLRDEVLKSTPKMIKGLPVSSTSLKETDQVDIGQLVEKHFREEFSRMEHMNKWQGSIRVSGYHASH